MLALLYLQRPSIRSRKPDNNDQNENNSEGTDEDTRGPQQPLIGDEDSADDSVGLRDSRGTSGDGGDTTNQAHVSVDYSPRVTEEPDGGFDIMFSPANSYSYNASDPFYRDQYHASMLSGTYSLNTIAPIINHHIAGPVSHPDSPQITPPPSPSRSQQLNVAYKQNY